jgi:Adenosine-deaminase (editase) domain
MRGKIESKSSLLLYVKQESKKKNRISASHFLNLNLLWMLTVKRRRTDNNGETGSPASSPTTTISSPSSASSSSSPHSTQSKSGTATVVSCAFADAVARAASEGFRRAALPVLDAWAAAQTIETIGNDQKKETVSFLDRYQTVVAAVIMRREDLEEVENRPHLTVVSLGVGTKFLSAARIQAEFKRGERGNSVRDMHAEALAQRGLRRFLALEARRYLPQQRGTENDDRSGSSDPAGAGLEPNAALSSGSNVLELVLSSPEAGDDRGDAGTVPGGRFRLRSGVTLHLYTSSVPCGNASVKMWARGQRPKTFPDLAAHEMPVLPHDRFFVTEKARGQVAVLAKRDAEVPGAPDPDADAPGAFVLPPGTSRPSALPRGTPAVMTCSDKLAKSNAVGCQGGLLSSIFEPVYMSSIVIGRKFGPAFAQRALCCRVQDFREPPVIDEAAMAALSRRAWKKATVGFARAPYVIHHPVLLGTAVNPVSAVQYGETERATFASGAPCVCAWLDPGTQQLDFDELDSRNGVIVVAEPDSSVDSNVSRVATASLGEQVAQILALQPQWFNCEAGALEKCEGQARTEFIKHVGKADTYQQARSILLARSDLLGDWIRSTREMRRDDAGNNPEGTNGDSLG